MTTARQPILTEECPLEDILPNPHNIRHHLDVDEDLVDSVRRQGVIEPVVLYEATAEDWGNGEPVRFALIAGHRRLEAAKRAGLETIPFTVRPRPSRGELAELMLIENLHRSDLDPIDEALALLEVKRGGRRGVKDIAKSIGRSSTWVSARLAIISKLPEDVWPLIREGQLSVTEAIAVAQAKGLSAEERARLCRIENNSNRSWEINNAVRKAEEQQRYDDTVKAWPGRQVGYAYPANVEGLRPKPRFEAICYGTDPGLINLPPEMGDAELQYVRVGVSSARHVTVWHLAPETLDPADFVPIALDEEMFDDEDRRMTLAELLALPDQALACKVERTPGFQPYRSREAHHRFCEHHRDVEVPWRSWPLAVCLNPIVHEEGQPHSGPSWDELAALHMAKQRESGQIPTTGGRRLVTAEDMFGADLKAAIEDSLTATLESIPAGIVAALVDTDGYELSTSNERTDADMASGPHELDLTEVVEQLMGDITYQAEELGHLDEPWAGSLRGAQLHPLSWVVDVAASKGLQAPAIITDVLSRPNPMSEAETGSEGEEDPDA